jgi:hypothetical protein
MSLLVAYVSMTFSMTISLSAATIVTVAAANAGYIWMIFPLLFALFAVYIIDFLEFFVPEEVKYLGRPVRAAAFLFYSITLVESFRISPEIFWIYRAEHRFLIHWALFAFNCYALPRLHFATRMAALTVFFCLTMLLQFKMLCTQDYSMDDNFVCERYCELGGTLYIVPVLPGDASEYLARSVYD